MAFLTAKGRVAYALLEIAESLGDQTGSGEIVIPHMINQKDLAALAGVARENTNRILKGWQQRKILSTSSHSYRIKDKAEARTRNGLGMNTPGVYSGGEDKSHRSSRT